MIRNKLKSKGHKIENIKFDEKNSKQLTIGAIGQLLALYCSFGILTYRNYCRKCSILEIESPQDGLHYIQELH